jgi:hypothetical protein
MTEGMTQKAHGYKRASPVEEDMRGGAATLTERIDA